VCFILPVVLSSFVLAASVASACTVRNSIALSHDTPLSSSTVAKYVCAPVLASVAKHCYATILSNSVINLQATNMSALFALPLRLHASTA
jgi:hypothetical protein